MKKIMIWLALMCLGLGLTGCIGQSPPTRYYHLDPMSPEAQNSPREKSALAVGIGPVSFPDVLDRSQIVTRQGASRYIMDDYERWGGSLKNAFSQVLAENLSVLLNTRKVAVFPWKKHFHPHYRMVLDVLRFDGCPGEAVRLEVRWAITGPKGEKALAVDRTTITRHLADAGMTTYVEGLNQTLKELSTHMAEQIRDLEASTSTEP